MTHTHIMLHIFYHLSLLSGLYPLQSSLISSDAQKGVESAVYFPLECRVDLNSLRTAEGCVTAAKTPDTVVTLEELASSWCAMVEQILAESSQMRREADDTGPLAELEYWKLRTAKFTSLIEQIKSHPVRSVFMTLHQAKSKVMKVRPTRTTVYYSHGS